MTPLLAAAMNGRTEVVKLLLERGADINARHEVRLICAQAFQFVTKAHTQFRCVVIVYQSNGSALSLAAQWGYLDTLEFLKDRAFDPESRNEVGG